MNVITVKGIVCNMQYSHESYGEIFNQFDIHVTRQSGKIDELKVIIPESLSKTHDIQDGQELVITGEIRTRNMLVEGKRMCSVYVFAHGVIDKLVQDQNNNSLYIEGFICKEPVYRETPSGREITDFIVAVNREKTKNSDYIPCIAWGRNAYRIDALSVGTKVALQGRFQSRDYVKKHEDGTEEKRTAYEVSTTWFAVEVPAEEGEENEN